MAKIYYFLGHEQYQPEELVHHAILAEQVGFDGVLISDHFHPWTEDNSASGYVFSTLGAIAQATKSIALLTGVVTPLFRYHPAVVAQASATVDRLSNGRFSLGVGLGESINESPLGYEFPNYKERSARMIEALTIMKALLNGEKFTFDGTYYKTKNAKLYSPPIQKVEIFLAAGGPKSAELAAQYADGVIVSVKDIAVSIERVTDPYIKNAKNSKVIASRWTIFADSAKDALSALGPWRGLRAPSRDSVTDPAVLQKEADTIDPAEILSRYTVLSNAKGYIDAYMPLITELHADIIVIQTAAHKSPENVIHLLGQEVLPVLKGH